MLRVMEVGGIVAEWAAIERLHGEAGVPVREDERDRLARWLEQNPELFHLYETEGRLAGYTSLIPICRESYHRRVAGAAGPDPEMATDEILTAVEYATARWDGVWIWVERLVAATAAVQQKLVAQVYHTLGRVYLKGLLVTPSDAPGEAGCRWLGLVERPAGAGDLAAGRKLWYADERVVAPTPDQPFGPATPARCLFLLVEQRFGPRPDGLALTPAERRVARLFYGEDREAEEIAGRLGMQPGTVKTHLQRIRGKAERVMGSRLSRRIGAYLAEHPGEMVERSADGRPPGCPPLK
jgi:DNA-binding CsgD family transcriptional regulator